MRWIPCIGYLINNQKLIVVLVRLCTVKFTQLYNTDKLPTNMLQSIHFQVGMIILLTIMKLMMTRLDAHYTDAWRNER